MPYSTSRAVESDKTWQNRPRDTDFLVTKKPSCFEEVETLSKTKKSHIPSILGLSFGNRQRKRRAQIVGELAEWSKAPDSKSGIPATVS